MTTSIETDVVVTRDGSVGIVTINRPQRLNAVTPSTGEHLSTAFRDLESDPEIRSIVLTGAGRGFCAGADISGDIGNARQVLQKIWNPLVQTMQNLELPIIAALNGIAAGAGASLALACDLRVAAESARIQLSFTKIGLLPDAGLTWMLPRIVGLARANELAMLARDIHAPEALQWGLINRVSEDGKALQDAVALGHDIGDLASSSMSAVKMAHQRTFDATLADQLELEANTQGWLQEQPDFTEAAKAFADKRAPRRASRQPGVRP